jgi:hypothetical protein
MLARACVWLYIYTHDPNGPCLSINADVAPRGQGEPALPLQPRREQTANMGGPDPQFNLFKYLISEKRCCESRVSKDLKRLSRLRVSLVIANHRGANIVDEDNSLKSAKEHKFMQRNE